MKTNIDEAFFKTLYTEIFPLINKAINDLNYQFIGIPDCKSDRKKILEEKANEMKKAISHYVDAQLIAYQKNFTDPVSQKEA